MLVIIIIMIIIIIIIIIMIIIIIKTSHLCTINSFSVCFPYFLFLPISVSLCIYLLCCLTMCQYFFYINKPAMDILFVCFVFVFVFFVVFEKKKYFFFSDERSWDPVSCNKLHEIH